MEQKKIPRIMIAAAGSGSGKTTVTCGLLQAFLDRGLKPASFKCGPDYIDPMFHSEVLGIKSRNLDLFFNDENTINYLLCRNAEAVDLAVLEGVMGYYDGLAGKSTDCSSYDLSRKTGTPVILVADCKGMSASIVALIKGFIELRKDHCIKGVILNRIPQMLYEEIKSLIEEELSIEVLGYLPVMADCRLESRHLGLVTAKEIGNLQEIITKVAGQMAASVDLDRILAIAAEASPIDFADVSGLQNASKRKETLPPAKIAVAWSGPSAFTIRTTLPANGVGAEIVPSVLLRRKPPRGHSGLSPEGRS